MVEDEVPSDGATQALPDQENVDLADRLMERFQPEGGQGLNAMLSNRAKSGAMVLAGLGFFICGSGRFSLDSSSIVHYGFRIAGGRRGLAPSSAPHDMPSD